MPSEKLVRHYSGKVKQIETEISIRSRLDGGNEYHSYKAIWDTGAMSSCISPKIVKEMNLPQFSVTMARGVGDEPASEQPVYLVDVKLSNGVVIEGVKMVGIEVGGTDAAIGMDVISRGNFATYYDEQEDMNMSFELLFDL